MNYLIKIFWGGMFLVWVGIAFIAVMSDINEFYFMETTTDVLIFSGLAIPIYLSYFIAIRHAFKQVVI
jgi:membrane protein implicated in regulation of membrane protease activity